MKTNYGNRKTKGTYTVSYFKTGIGNAYYVVASKEDAYKLRAELRAQGYDSHVHIN